MASDLQDNWTKLPNKLFEIIIKDKTLTKNQIKILLQINRQQFGYKNQECYTGSYNKLAVKSEVTWNVLNLALTSLENKGYIEIIDMIQTNTKQTNTKQTNRLVQIRLIDWYESDHKVDTIHTNTAGGKPYSDNGSQERKERLKESIKDTLKESKKRSNNYLTVFYYHQETFNMYIEMLNVMSKKTDDELNKARDFLIKKREENDTSFYSGIKNVFETKKEPLLTETMKRIEGLSVDLETGECDDKELFMIKGKSSILKGNLEQAERVLTAQERGYEFD